MNMTIETSGTYTITLYPDFDYTFIENPILRIANRRNNGDLIVFVSSETYFSYTIPINNISSSDASIINSWWQTATTLRFFPDTAINSSYKNATGPGIGLKKD